MSDVDSTRLQLNDVEMRQSSTRQTPITSFGSVMRNGINGTLGTVSNQAASAGYAIPGASVVGAAITGVGSVRDANLTTTTNPNAGSVVASTGGSVGLGGGVGGVGSSSVAGTGVTTAGTSSMDAVANQATSGNPNAQLLMATQQMQEMNQQFNLQYLQLQEGMQAENRQFTALSNVMKTKNDTAKNSLSNLK